MLGRGRGRDELKHKVKRERFLRISSAGSDYGDSVRRLSPISYRYTKHFLLYQQIDERIKATAICSPAAIYFLFVSHTGVYSRLSQGPTRKMGERHQTGMRRPFLSTACSIFASQQYFHFTLDRYIQCRRHVAPFYAQYIELFISSI